MRERVDRDLRQPLVAHLVGRPAHRGDPRAVSVRSVITTVTETDLPELLLLMRGYCDFYGVDPSDDALLAMSAHPDRRSGAGGNAADRARRRRGRAVGFATIFWTWTTLSASRLGVMNDLFVTADARGGGYADALIAECAERCRARGATELGPGRRRLQRTIARAGRLRARRREARRALARLLAGRVRPARRRRTRRPAPRPERGRARRASSARARRASSRWSRRPQARRRSRRSTSRSRVASTVVAAVAGVLAAMGPAPEPDDGAQGAAVGVARWKTRPPHGRPGHPSVPVVPPQA